MQQIKEKITEAAPRHKLQKPYPYDSMWVHPPDPTMRKSFNVAHFHLRPVFVWLPELTQPRGVTDGRLPCPRCKSAKDVIVKGWTQKGSRRAILPDSCCDLLGKYYMCHRCMENNKSKPKASGLHAVLCEFGSVFFMRMHLSLACAPSVFPTTNC